MNLQEILLPLTGDKLIEAMTGAKEKRKVIAEGLIYEKTILMIAADPGAGKSTISTQVAIELAAGLPLFGYFAVPQPIKVFYIQTERSIQELLERFETISKSLPIVKDNIVITDEYQKLDLLNTTHSEMFIQCIKRDCNNAVMLFIDPIYSTISGGLKEDKPASTFTKVMSRVQKEVNCSLWYNHHTVKPQYTHNGEKIDKEDPFYGSQWIKAHITGSYNMSKSEDGVKLTCKKDTYGILTKEIPLEYNPETELCTVSCTKLTALDKVKNFIKARELDKKTFSFRDLEEQTQLCTRTVREILVHSSVLDKIMVVSTFKNKKLYKVKDS